jgi:hypothetical protein
LALKLFINPYFDTTSLRYFESSIDGGEALMQSINTFVGFFYPFTLKILLLNGFDIDRLLKYSLMMPAFFGTGDFLKMEDVIFYAV